MKNILLLFISLTVLNLHSQMVTTVTSEFKGSGGVCLDDSGNVYIGDFGDSLAGADPDGLPNNIMQLDTNQNLTVYSTDFVGASGNNFDNNGTLYQSDIWDSGIYKIVGGVRTFVTSEGIDLPVGIVFDSNDNFYVSNCGSNTIQKVTPGGTSTVFSSGTEFNCPNGMTIDEDDNLYVVNFSNTNVVKIDQSGTPTVIANTQAPNGHIDYDPVTKNLYIASFAGQQILYLNKDNPQLQVLSGIAGVRGNNDGSLDTATFSNPNGIAVTQTGDSIYVNSAVQITGAALNPQYVRLITDVLLTVNDIEIESADVTAYPNPAYDVFTIEINLKNDISNLAINVYSVTGKLVAGSSDIATSNQHIKSTIDVSNLASGVYLYTINSSDKQLFSGKMVRK